MVIIKGKCDYVCKMFIVSFLRRGGIVIIILNKVKYKLSLKLVNLEVMQKGKEQ